MRIISGIYRGKKLVSAPEEITRPTLDRAKEGLFNILENQLRQTEMNWPSIRMADVFAGSGAIGIEALSRGAKQVIFFENNPIAIQYMNQNLKSFSKENFICYKDALKPNIISQPVDILFMDAPYHRGLIEKALPLFYQAGWIGKETLIVLEIDVNEMLQLPDFLEEKRTVCYGRNQFIFAKYEKGEKNGS